MSNLTGSFSEGNVRVVSAKEAATPKVLIVDDRQENLFSMEQVLKGLDAQLFTAESGNEALALTLSHEFALVLLDVQMPGMDGFEVASLMHKREETRHVPIIFVTAASTDESYVARGYDSGAVDYLFKPIDSVILRSKVKVFTDLHRKSKALAVLEQLRHTKAELERSNSELSEFAYVASHDLQAPLRQITAMIGLLNKRMSKVDDPTVLELVERISDSAGRMREFIRDLLEYSRVGRSGGEPEPVELADVLRRVVEGFAGELEATSGRVHVQYEAFPVIIGAKFIFVQLFQNLVGNAIKFRGERAPEIRIETERIDGGWIFSVSDNGIGIEREYFDRIFGVFQRLHGRDEYPGTGIGLSTCKKIVEMYGGEIAVASEPGVGTTFRVRIMEPSALASDSDAAAKS